MGRVGKGEIPLVVSLACMNKNKNWSRELYEMASLRLKDSAVDTHEYSEKAFGSWYFGAGNVLLVYAGRDEWLIVRKGETAIKTIARKNINSETLLLMIDLFLKEKER